MNEGRRRPRGGPSRAEGLEEWGRAGPWGHRMRPHNPRFSGSEPEEATVRVPPLAAGVLGEEPVSYHCSGDP